MAAGLGPTQADEVMDDPIEDSPPGSDDYVPPAMGRVGARGRVRGRAAAEEVSSSDDDDGGRVKKRPSGKKGKVGGAPASRRR